MAVELEIAKPVTAGSTRAEEASHCAADRLCQHASLASCLEDVANDDQQMVERIVRNRQRLWLHLFLWDSSLSLAFGKATRFSQDYLTRDEAWCFHSLATVHDAVTTACVVLRRRMVRENPVRSSRQVGLSDSLRSEITMRVDSSSGWVKSKVDEVLEPWRAFWTPQCCEILRLTPAYGSLLANSPYLELVYRHSRLWTLSYALQTISSRNGMTQDLANDCFASALSTCEFACEQLRQSRGLWVSGRCPNYSRQGFPNTMGPMLSFEVLLAVRVSVICVVPTKNRLTGSCFQLPPNQVWHRELGCSAYWPNSPYSSSEWVRHLHTVSVLQQCTDAICKYISDVTSLPSVLSMSGRRWIDMGTCGSTRQSTLLY